MELISADEAKKQVAEHELKPRIQLTHLNEAHGKVLASAIKVPGNIPAYAQSAMDGYAIRFSDMRNEMKLVGEMTAGESRKRQLQQGTAMRIFTGAPLPVGADTVVIQEKVERTANDSIFLLEKPAETGLNVRPAGSEAKAGEEAMSAGMLLSPAALGFLAGLGIAHVEVYQTPKVAVILTGNELISPGSKMGFGKVYDSNSFTINAALAEMGIRNVSLHYVGDRLYELKDVLEKVLSEADYVLLTGGVSVGDYDFVLEASAACGIQTVFHGIRQKPGKPLFFGMNNTSLIFGLPGNPSSVLSCFINYVRPSLMRFMRLPDKASELSASLKNAYRKPAGMVHFVKGYYDAQEKSVEVLTGQESYRMRSFAVSNCLIVLPENKVSCEEGDEVDVLPLPWKTGGLA